MAFNKNIIPAATAAQAVAQPFDATAQTSVLIAADNLAAAETCTILVNVTGSTYVPMSNVAGSACTLTATVPAVLLPGGVTYGVTKVLTAGACGVWGTPVFHSG